MQDVFVAREELNGTLLLAAVKGASCTLLAYLTISDQQCGTLLLKVDGEGFVDMTLKTPLRGDSVNSAMLDDRHLRFQIPLGDDTMMAF